MLCLKGDFNLKDLIRLLSAGYSDKLIKSVTAACICGVCEQLIETFTKGQEELDTLN